MESCGDVHRVKVLSAFIHNAFQICNKAAEAVSLLSCLCPLSTQGILSRHKAALSCKYNPAVIMIFMLVAPNIACKRCKIPDPDRPAATTRHRQLGARNGSLHSVSGTRTDARMGRGGASGTWAAAKASLMRSLLSKQSFTRSR